MAGYEQYIPPGLRGPLKDLFGMARVTGDAGAGILRAVQEDPLAVNQAIGESMIGGIQSMATDPVGTVRGVVSDTAGTVQRALTNTAVDYLPEGVTLSSATPEQLKMANDARYADLASTAAMAIPGTKALKAGAKAAGDVDVSGLAADATYAGRSIAQGDPRGIIEAFQRGGEGESLSAAKAGDRFEVKGSDFFPEARVGGRGKDPALYTPFSSIKSATPPALWAAAGERQGGLLDAPILEPSDFKNKRMYFATGDRTTNQDLVQEVNDYLLRNGGQQTYGGPRYMDQVDRGVWASEANPMKAKSNAWIEANKRNEDYIAAYMPMGERSGDFSKHMSDVYGGMIAAGENSALWTRNVAKIDEAIAKKFPKIKDRPSFSSPAFPEWLSSQKGGVRASLIKFFDSSQMQKLGVPEVGPARFAITQPELMLSDTASVGYRFGTPKRGAVSERTDLHPSYNAEIAMEPGTTSSTLGFDLPWLIGARDSALPKAASFAREKGVLDLKAKPKDVKSYMGNPNINQLVDDQWIDEASLYKEILNSQGKLDADRYVMGLLQSYMAK
jgi:hypothetical protein